MKIVGSILTRGNEKFNIFITSFRKRGNARRFTTSQLNTPCLQNLAQIGKRKQNVLIVGSQVSSAYPAKCGMQREAIKNVIIIKRCLT